MNPCYLEPEELEYELIIRNVTNIGNSRNKTTMLRKMLANEFNGIATAPARSGQQFDSGNEIIVCKEIYESILRTNVNRREGSESVNVCMSRLKHLLMRLARIEPKTERESDEIVQLTSSAKHSLNHLNVSASREVAPPPPQPTPRSSINLMQNNEGGACAISANVQSQDTVPVTGDVFYRDARFADPNFRRAYSQGAIRKENNMAVTGNAVDRRQQRTPDHFGNIHSEYPPLNESLFDGELLSLQEQVEIETEINSTLNPRAEPFHPPTTAAPFRSSMPFATLSSDRRRSTQAQNNNFPEENLNFPTQTLHYPIQNSRFPSQTQNFPTQTLNFPTQTSGFPIRDFLIEHQNVQQPYTTQSRREYNPDRRTSGDRNRPESGGGFDFSRAFDRSHKSVPVHMWKIYFSGDGKGLHLYDFLSQIAMYRRSEQVSDNEMLASIVHLLCGRARLWYQAEYDTIYTWEDLVAGLKREFLPPNYNFVLLNDISNRMQKSHESSAEYMTHMQSLFKWVATDLSEAHKLFIVQKNLLPKYAIGVSTRDIRTLAELSEVCRRMDSVFRQTQVQIPFQDAQNYTQYRSYQRPREIHEMYNVDEPIYDAVNVDGEQQECCEIRRRRIFENHSNRHQSANQIAKSADATKETTCWNCDRNGHSFSDCDQPRLKKFCFRCGNPNVICPSCPKCQGNGNPNSANMPAEQNSTENAAKVKK